eukprot:Skav222080  [mRNA]  locus=scaffold4586:119421:126100:- [translate_table: standard]
MCHASCTEKDKGGKDKDKDKSEDIGEAASICRPCRIISYMLDQEYLVYAVKTINSSESSRDCYDLVYSTLLTLTVPIALAAGLKMVEDTGGTSADSAACLRSRSIIGCWFFPAIRLIVAEEQKYLYEPFELVTNSRRRLQIHLLQSLSADYRMHFNELFEVTEKTPLLVDAGGVVLVYGYGCAKACQGDKKNIIAARRKTIRVASWQTETSLVGPPVHCAAAAMHDSSDHSNATTPKELQIEEEDHEITVEKWISPEESIAQHTVMLPAATIIHTLQERLRQLRENDAGQRALVSQAVQMMGGTLKTKKA